MSTANGNGKPASGDAPSGQDAGRCPQCGGQSKILMTRKRGGRRIRRRECLACVHRWTTVEMVVHEP